VEDQEQDKEELKKEYNEEDVRRKSETNLFGGQTVIYDGFCQ